MIKQTIEANETYLVIKVIVHQVRAIIKNHQGETTNTNPAVVATALPPLNLKYTGYIWPKIAASGAK